jgi:hypothetical protein
MGNILKIYDQKVSIISYLNIVSLLYLLMSITDKVARGTRIAGNYTDKDYYSLN